MRRARNGYIEARDWSLRLVTPATTTGTRALVAPAARAIGEGMALPGTEDLGADLRPFARPQSLRPRAWKYRSSTTLKTSILASWRGACFAFER